MPLVPLLALLFLFATGARAQEAAPELDTLRDDVAGEVGSRIFIDAERWGFTRDTTRQTYDGDVVAIGGGTIIAADHVAVDRTKGEIEATGKVVVMAKSAIFLGDRVVYQLKNGDLKIDGATMTVNDEAEAEIITRRILGFTAKEAAFEQKRKLRLAEIEDRKARLRTEARRQAEAAALKGGSGAVVDEELVARYTRLLEQSDMTKDQPNPSITRIPAERREMILRRREFYEKSRIGALTAVKDLPAALYFKVQGEVITRTDGNDFRSHEALFTPCYCEAGEAPAWGFRSGEMFAQVGGYADLYHPVLEIKGIPVLYLPYLKIPLKSERQTGFLMPTIAFEERSGNIFSQPVYFDLGKDADATLSTDVFENRGTRIGLEYRVQTRESSGWELKAEAIRDHLWLDERTERQELRSLYTKGLDDAVVNAAAVAEKKAAGETVEDIPYVPDPSLAPRQDWENRLSRPDFWPELKLDDKDAVDKKKELIDDTFAVPSNTWRGSYAWRGNTFFAPRLSLVSNAEVLSDHRYASELRVPNGIEELIFGSTGEKAYADTKAQVNLDGKDLYAGLGLRYGDNQRLNERFEGQQTPLRLKVQSRKFSLLPSASPLPLYGQVTADQIRVTEVKGRLIQADRSLGDGSWRRVRFDTVAPLVTERIVQVDHFSESEGRYVEAAHLGGTQTEMRSFRTGIDLILPIDGKGRLPDWLADEEPVCDRDAPSFSEADCERYRADPNKPEKWVHHLMDWRVRISLRPSVVKRGPYQDPSQTDGKLAYFSSDLGTPLSSGEVAEVPEEERMRRHQRIELSTHSVWRLLSRSWKLVKGAEKTDGAKTDEANTTRTKAEKESTEERARRELLMSLDRPLTPDTDLMDRRTKLWLIDRYQLDDSYYSTPMAFSASIAYDFLDAAERTRLHDEHAPESTLPKGWKDFNASYSVTYDSFTFGAALIYDIYARHVQKEDFNLDLPTFYKTNIGLGYTIELGPDPDDSRQYIPTNTRRFKLVTSLIPAVNTYIRLQKQDKHRPPDSYEANVLHAEGFEYKSDSRCWGLGFAREKNFGDPEIKATYALQLSVIFMGQQRPLPNMQSGVVRDVRRAQ